MLLRTQLPSRTPRTWTSRLLTAPPPTVPQPKQMPPITALQARPHNTCKNEHPTVKHHSRVSFFEKASLAEGGGTA